jgi:hypothetical protein
MAARRSAQARAAISGPIPAGSPQLMTMVDTVDYWFV